MADIFEVRLLGKSRHILVGLGKSYSWGRGLLEGTKMVGWRSLCLIMQSARKFFPSAQELNFSPFFSVCTSLATLSVSLRSLVSNVCFSEGVKKDLLSVMFFISRNLGSIKILCIKFPLR